MNPAREPLRRRIGVTGLLFGLLAVSCGGTEVVALDLPSEVASRESSLVLIASGGTFEIHALDPHGSTGPNLRSRVAADGPVRLEVVGLDRSLSALGLAAGPIDSLDDPAAVPLSTLVSRSWTAQIQGGQPLEWVEADLSPAFGQLEVRGLCPTVSFRALPIEAEGVPKLRGPDSAKVYSEAAIFEYALREDDWTQTSSRALGGLPGRIADVVELPSGEVYFSGGHQSTDGAFYGVLWEVSDDGNIQRAFETEGGSLFDIHPLDDGRILTGSNLGEFGVWDKTTYEPLLELPASGDHGSISIRSNGQGDIIAVAGDTARVHRFTGSGYAEEQVVPIPSRGFVGASESEALGFVLVTGDGFIYQEDAPGVWTQGPTFALGNRTDNVFPLGEGVVLLDVSTRLGSFFSRETGVCPPFEIPGLERRRVAQPASSNGERVWLQGETDAGAPVMLELTLATPG